MLSFRLDSCEHERLVSSRIRNYLQSLKPSTRNHSRVFVLSDNVFQRGYFLLGAVLSGKSNPASAQLVLILLQAVHGSSALLAGIQLLPYTLGSSLVSLIGFYVTEKTKAHNAVIRVGLGLMAIGFGSYF
jgi:hypothetical protein